jgi:hypothetical protein
MKAPARAAFSACSTTGMATAADLEGAAVVERGARIALLGGDLGEAGLAIELGQCAASSPSCCSWPAMAALNSANTSCSMARPAPPR